MSIQLESLLDSGIYFPHNLSGNIISAMLSSKRVLWKEREELLDEIVRRIIPFGYAAVPGIRRRLDNAGISPDKVHSFQDYERSMPWLSVPEMHEMGQEQFELNNNTHLRSAHPDFAVIGNYVLEERVSKARFTVTPTITGADARAAYLALGGELSRLGHLPAQILINQKGGDNLPNTLLKDIIIPSLESAGISASLLAGPNGVLAEETGLLLPPQNRRILEDFGDSSNLPLVLRADGMHNHANEFHLGDYNATYGVFPNLGSNMPFPLLVRAVDSNGRIPRANGQPDTGERGRVVVDRFFSAYELPTKWYLLKSALSQVIGYMDASRLETVSVGDIESLWGNYSFKDEFYSVLRKVSINADSSVGVDALQRVYSLALGEYIQNSVRIGVPNGTWLLRVGFPIAAKVDENGAVKSVISLSSGRKAYASDHEWDIKYSSAEVPYISANIIGSPYELPTVKGSNLEKRVKNALEGKGLFEQSRCYTFSVPMAGNRELKSLLESANAYSSPTQSGANLSLDEVVSILAELHGLADLELAKAFKGEKSMISAFVDHTRIPISEISDMVKKAKEDFITDNGLGLKRIAYSAFVDPNADILNLPSEALMTGIGSLSQRKTMSPAFMVTPGNVTLYDAFYVFSQILMAKMADQSKGSFTMYLRPSESDIAMNFMVYNFMKIAERIDPENKRGIRTMFQKAYWDPNHDKEFMPRAMSNASVGIYWGRADTYAKIRFNEALRFAGSDYSGEQINLLYNAGEKFEFRNTKIILDNAIGAGVDNGLVGKVKDFISRHYIYPEPVGLRVILPDASQDEVINYVRSVVEQAITGGARDCTNAHHLAVPQEYLPLVRRLLEEEAGKFVAGDPMNPETNMTQYDTDYLKGTRGIIESNRDNTRVIAPIDAATGKRAKEAISPQANYTGVIVTENAAEDIIGAEDSITADVWQNHLANELPIPWLNVTSYSSVPQLVEVMRRVLGKYETRTGYSRFLQVSAIGKGLLEPFREQVLPMADLFKSGAEAYTQFVPYRPHQGNFVIRNLTN